MSLALLATISLLLWYGITSLIWLAMDEVEARWVGRFYKRVK